MVQSSAVGPVLQHIEHLDDALELARARAALVALEAQTSQRANADALCDLLDRVRKTVASLCEYVVDVAVAEPTLDRRIVALRARLDLTLRQLQDLSEAAPEVTAPIWSGPYQSATDVTTHVVDKLSRVDTAFLGALTANESVTRAQIETAVSTAERTLDALGGDPGLACFIGAAASVSTPRFRRASRMLAALLGVPLAPSDSAPGRVSVPRRSAC